MCMKKKNKTFKAYEKILRKDFDWDFGPLLILEKKKLSRMHNHFLNSNTLLPRDNERIAQNISLCLRLIDIILMEDPVTNEFYRRVQKCSDNKDYLLRYPSYVNYRNENRFFEGNKRPIKDFLETPGRSKEPVYLLEDLRRNKAMFLYNKVRAYNMFSWWE